MWPVFLSSDLQVKDFLRLFQIIDGSNPYQSFVCNRRFDGFLIALADCFYCIGKMTSRMCKAVRILKTIQLTGNLVILLQPVCHQDSVEVLVIRLRMIAVPCLLILVHNNFGHRAEFSYDVDSHITLRSRGSIIMNHFHWSLIALIRMRFQLSFFPLNRVVG